MRAWMNRIFGLHGREESLGARNRGPALLRQHGWIAVRSPIGSIVQNAPVPAVELLIAHGVQDALVAADVDAATDQSG